MKAIKTTALYALYAFLAFAAMVTAGLMYAIATAPEAHAGAPRVPVAVNPVTPAMQQSLTGDYNAFMTCVGTRRFDNLAALKVLEDANNAAGWAAAQHDLAKFNTEAATVRSEIARLKPTFGC